MKTARQLCVAILFVTSLAALLGGYLLIVDPDGHSLRLMLEDLKGTPFTDYSLPGWILLWVIGVGSILAAVSALQHQKFYPYLVIAEGICLLFIMMVYTEIQRELQFIPIVFGLFAVALILLGNLIRKYLIEKMQQVQQVFFTDHPVKKSHYHKNRRRGH